MSRVIITALGKSSETGHMRGAKRSQETATHSAQGLEERSSLPFELDLGKRGRWYSKPRTQVHKVI